MEKRARSSAKYVRITPQKARVVASAIRGLSVKEAMSVLKHLPFRSAKTFINLLKAAKASAESQDMKSDLLVISEVMVDKSMIIKRQRAESKGRGVSIFKRCSHLTLIIGEGARGTKYAS